MRTLRTMVALVAFSTAGLLNSALSYCQTPDNPVAIVSIAPFDRMIADFQYLMRSCGVPQIGGMGSMMAKQYTQGLDSTRPAGVLIHLADSQPVPLGFFPLKDRKAFFGALAGAGLIPDELGNGKFAFDANGRTIFAKEAGGWLYIGQDEGSFDKLPADPSAVLGKLPSKYDLAIRINMQALPKDIKDMAIGQMRAGFERSLAQQSNQSAEEKAAAEEVGNATIAQMERMFKETEQITAGWNSQAANQSLQLDGEVQFLEGTEMAMQIGKLQGLTSDFTGLLISGAAMTMRTTSVVSESDKAMAKNNLRNLNSQVEKQIDDSGSLPSANKESLKKFARGMLDILEKTINAGKFDLGGAVALNDNKVRAVFGGLVADGKQVEKQVKELVASLGSGPEIPKFQFNYAKHMNVDLHKASVPIATDDPKVTKVFGNELKLVVGTGEKSFFISLDPDGDSVIKSALDRIGSTKNAKVIPGEMIFEVGQILSFVQAISPNPLVDGALQAVQQASGKDKIRVLNNAIPRGLVYQVQVDEGVLKGIGAAVQTAQGGGGF